ncbi:VOC family protein [Aliikangiella sp. IMCC44653]
MPTHHKINYVEFPVKDLVKAKEFYQAVFGWRFIDYGDTYCAISNAGIDAGFYLSEQSMQTQSGSALLVIYSHDLEKSIAAVEAAGGKIVKPIFNFPGGKRFQFVDTNLNEFAVWSE